METLKAPNRRQLLLAGAALALASRASAEAARPLKIGIMNDMSSVYSDFQGIGSVIAAQLAVDDFSAKLGVPVEIVSADHQNKPDVGAAIARRWFDTENVDVDHGSAEFRRRPRRPRGRRGEEQGGDRLGRGLLGADRSEMLAQFRSLDLRHLCLGRRRSGKR